MTLKIGVLTISDRAYQGTYEDYSGKEIINVMNDYIISPKEIIYKLIPDEKELIAEALIGMCDKDECQLIFTTGGTGPSARDVTPEAMDMVCHRFYPGFGEIMREKSLKRVPTAILSRQTAGTRNHSLIVNLPGKPASIRLCIHAVFPAIPYCIELMDGPSIQTDDNKIRVFRPKKK